MNQPANVLPSSNSTAQNQQNNNSISNSFLHNNTTSKSISNAEQILPSFLSYFIDNNFLELIGNISIYQADFSSINPNVKGCDVLTIMKGFLTNIQNDINRTKSISSQYPTDVIKTKINFIRQLLGMRDDINSRLITYDNLETHFPNANITIQRLVNNLKQNRITNIEEFRKKFDEVLLTVQAYNEMKQLKVSLKSWDDLIDEIKNNKRSLVSSLTKYKEIISESYNNLSQLNIINKAETETDSIIISDKKSIEDVANHFTTYLSEQYSLYKSGYSVIDDNLNGIESSSMHIISGPSNHAKSIFMINLLSRIIISNLKEFQPGDTFIFVTLEDDLFKLLRRFTSIFGNINSSVIKNLSIKASSLLRRQKNTDISNNNDSLYYEVKQILVDLLTYAILTITGENVNIILKHCNENVFTPSDAARLIDDKQIKGYKVKGILLDYIDVMAPTGAQTSFSENDYSTHGQIVHELRLLGRNYAIPVISITQNNKLSENFQQSLSNINMGDSFKKVRYSDYIYMIRIRDDLDILSDQVKNEVIGNMDTSSINLTDLVSKISNHITPIEFKITKAKDGPKNIVKFHIFNSLNLRIYDYLNELYNDLTNLQKQSCKFQNDIDLLGVNTFQINSKINESVQLI